MEKYYTNERNVQMLIYILKAHNIRKIIASPGTTNLTFVGSVQNDPYFQVFSSVDERSAAYLACGMAEESGEPVVLSCTGATASRNYFPGLTEAYYNKIPVLAVTSTQHPGRIGHNMPQVIDRTNQPNDTVLMSKQVRAIATEEDAWDAVVSINEALLELRHRGGGPVHINLQTTYSRDYSVQKLPAIRVINRICYKDSLPELKAGRVGIFVGEHIKWSEELTASVEEFCEKYNAVVFCDQTSNYKGRYAVYPHLACSQDMYQAEARNVDVLIHIGNISGASMHMCPKEVWRVNPDGKVRDTFRKLKMVFEMEEVDFFKKYNEKESEKKETSFFSEWKNECEKFEQKSYKLPFSNVWIAKQTIEKLPNNASVYFAILNTLRSWDYFAAPQGITGYSNTGGFGIDGGLSTIIGASLVNPEKLYFAIIGDLGFFYDMNVLGNRHVGKNIRILLLNNARGTEFTNYNHPGAEFGENAKAYIAAAGHFGNKSEKLVHHYAEDLGFTYICARTKEEYLEHIEDFVSNQISQPMIFEVFTNGEDESQAIQTMRSLEIDSKMATKSKIKAALGKDRVATLKKIIGK